MTDIPPAEAVGWYDHWRESRRDWYEQLGLCARGEAEKLLKNAKTELWNEHEEIGNYLAIESLAEALRDRDTAKLAREFRKQEERMAAFLQKLIPKCRIIQCTLQIVNALIRQKTFRQFVLLLRSFRSFLLLLCIFSFLLCNFPFPFRILLLFLTALLIHHLIMLKPFHIS